MSNIDLILVSEGRPDIHLNAKNPLTIGREKYNDLVLTNLLVSRQHAVIVWNDGSFHLKDLNSQNGTMLNDKPVSDEVIAPGDIIKIGGFVFAVHTFNEKRDIKRPKPFNVAMHSTLRSTTEVIISAAGFHGDLSSVSMSDIVQLIQQTLKTGLLKLTSELKDDIGCMYFDRGDIVHAESRGLTGDSAALILLQEIAGSFDFQNNVSAPIRSVAGTTMWLLLEAHRMYDERKR